MRLLGYSCLSRNFFSPPLFGMVGFSLALLGIFNGIEVQANDVESLRAGVVRIVAKSDDGSKVGSGIIVKQTENRAIILTASHVIEGAKKIQVAFYRDPLTSLPGNVYKMEGDDPKGLGILKVEGKLPPGITSLQINPAEHAKAGESVMMIGHPRTAGVPWMIAQGTIGGLDGRLLLFSGPIEEGSSGGPLIVNNEVIGVIVEKFDVLGRAVPAGTIRTTLESWLIHPSPISPKRVEASDPQTNILEGFTCETFREKDTLGEIRKRGLKKALHQAILSSKAYWEATSQVSTMRLKEDFLEGISSNLLRNIQLINFETKPGEQFCFTSSAEFKLASLKEYIQGRGSTRMIAEETKNSPLTVNPDFDLLVWTNKENNRFFEDDSLEIYVQTEINAYLKVDYFTAEGTVTHLVPQPSSLGSQISTKVGEALNVGKALGANFIINPPFGIELIEVCASTSPIKGSRPDKLFDDAKKYAQSQTRGVKVFQEAKVACQLLEINTSSKT